MINSIDNKNRRVLVVDDDKMARTLVSKTLEYEGYQVYQANSGQLALQVISECKPHLILLDVNMPGLNGLETLKEVRLKDEYVSCIFVSANSQTEDVIRGLEAGADDYVCKPFEVLELLARVRAQLRIKDLHDSLKKANDRLKELVEIDDLTGLFNMRSLYNRLDFELDRGRRYNRFVSVIMMDLDHFKRANDEHDHLFGSFVIAQVGKIIRTNIRKVDFAARYGGDEFLVVLTEISLEGATTFANRLREKIAASTFENETDKMLLTGSLGLAIVNPNQCQIDARALVRAADRALYRAKENGRNRVEVEDLNSKPVRLCSQGPK